MVVSSLLLIETFVKGLDKVTDLLKRGEQQRADLFRNFVEPAWKDFEAVHQNYLDSLKRYTDLLNDVTKPITHSHPIFKVIEQDSLYTDAMRAKVAEAQRFAGDPALGSLIARMTDYLVTVPRTFTFLLTGDEPKQKPTMADFARCLPRTTLKDQLRFVASKEIHTEEQRRLALLCVAGAVEGLQASYGRALVAYNDVKVKLLTPKKIG